MNVFEIIQGTPWWVWALFTYLMFVSIQALKPRVVPLMRLLVMPVIFLTWGLYSLYSKNTRSDMLFLWLACIAIGLYIGWRLWFSRSISFDKKTGLVHLPGSWLPLVLSLSFFGVKYVLGATYAINSDLRTDIIFISINMLTSGIITGISWGRFLHIVSALRRN